MRYKYLPKCLSLLAIGILIILIIAYNISKPDAHTKNVFVLNTYISVTVYGTHAEAMAQDAISIVTDAEKIFSAHLPDSELSVLNTAHKTGVPYPVSNEMFTVLENALVLCEKTQGKFDITIKPVLDLWSITENPRVPSEAEIALARSFVDYRKLKLDAQSKTVTFLADNMQIDLGGIAKGYVADKVAAHLKNAYGATVDLGGNVIVLGKHKGDWKIGIQTPFGAPGAHTAIIKAPTEKTTTVVTSGAYERNFEKDGQLYHHIINPATGYPHNGEIESVTVIGESSMTADAYSTYLFMCTPEEAIHIARTEGFDVLIQTKDKAIHTTLTDFNITDKTYRIK